ncbi:MAG: decarboxylating 6-phosphogluconate dehydrogenase [Planctomycetes bacterium]|nr:decarboxylating 6-phosphogluconate dehydrogenase [Planctomycetota bacterium]
MDIVMVGLGKMGANMTRRLLRGGHSVMAYDRSHAIGEELAAEGASAASSIEGAIASVKSPRTVWMMVPSGEATRAVLAEVVALLEPGDCVIDGGNTDWRDDAARAAQCAEKGIAYLDCGTSGGLYGLTEGYCLMVGGDKTACDRVRPIFDTLATKDGFAYVGSSGAGHYAKMVHNAIEYGMMQSLAEGFELLQASPQGIDPAQVAGLWRHGSVIRSWLLDLSHQALRKDPKLDAITGYVSDSGEGRWAVETAIARDVPATVLAAALFARFQSRQDDSFAMKLLAALRREFGGHAVISK